MSERNYDNAMHMMEVRGGSFVRALAHCWYMADTTNKALLRTTFAKYFDAYAAQFEALEAQRLQAAKDQS